LPTQDQDAVTEGHCSQQIADDIAARIASGEYPPGAQLPSYRQLGDLYSVSISTAQRVILILSARGLVFLSARGLVYGEQGRGVFVNDADQD
jgi:GntR family transcriptional regulator